MKKKSYDDAILLWIMSKYGNHGIAIINLYLNLSILIFYVPLDMNKSSNARYHRLRVHWESTVTIPYCRPHIYLE